MNVNLIFGTPGLRMSSLVLALLAVLVPVAAMAQPAWVFQRTARIPISDVAGGGYPSGSAKATAFGLIDNNSSVDMVVGYMANNWNTINGPTYRLEVYTNTGNPASWTPPSATLSFVAAALPEPPHYTSFNEKYDTIEDIAIADIDRDGINDIVFCTHVDGVMWFRQTSFGVWTGTPYTILGRNVGYNYYVNCRRVLAVNLDGDPELEVIVARGETSAPTGFNSTGRVSVFNRTGALPYTWTESTVENFSGSAAFPISLRAANLAGTSALDLVVCWKASNTVKWYLNDGAGGFTANTPTGVLHNEPYDTGFADVNKDGRQDIIVVQRNNTGNGASVRVMFNTGQTDNNNFMGVTTVSNAYVGYRNAGDPTYDTVYNDKYPIYVKGGDFDADGDGDFFVSWNSLSTPALGNGDVVYFQNLDGSGTSWSPFSLYTSGLNSPADTGPMQMDIITAAPSATNPAGFPDPYQDLVVYNRTSKTLSFWDQTTYTTAPYLANLVVIGARAVDVTFSEAMNASDVATLSYYTASGGGQSLLVDGDGNPANGNNPTGVSLVSGNTYRLTWSAGQLTLGQPLTITANAAMRDASGFFIRQPRFLTVTVTDTQAPTAVCQDLARALNLTTVTVSATEINNGTTDNWTPPSPIEFDIKRTSDPPANYAASILFTCADVGAQSVTLRARDAALNEGTCIATVTISGTMQNILQLPASQQLYVNDALPAIQVDSDCGVPPYTYQWQYSADLGFGTPQNISNGPGGHPAAPAVTVVIGGSSPTSTLTFTTLPLAVEGYYRCVATDSASPTASTATSDPVHLEVHSPVSATAPTGGHRNTGGSIQFDTTASGGYPGYTYAWYKASAPGVPLVNGPQGSGSTISGATTNSMTISNLQLADADSYYCIATDTLVSGSGSNGQSGSAALTVTDLLAISGPVPGVVNTYLTAQSFDATASGGDGVYAFTWEFDRDGFGIGNPAVVLTNGGTLPNGVTGVTITTPSPGVSRLALNNLQAPPPTPATSDGEYRCTVSDGSPDPNVTTAAATLKKRNQVGVTVVKTAPIGNPGNYFDALTLTATASGGFEPLSYQWALNTGSGFVDLSNGTTVYSRLGRDPNDPPGDFQVDVPVTITGAQGPVLNIDHPLFGVHGGTYRCTVTDSVYPAQQPNSIAQSQLAVTVTDRVAIIRHPTGGEYYDGNIEDLDVAATGGTTPQSYTFQWRFGPNIIQNSSDNPLEFVAKAGPATIDPFGQGWIEWFHDSGLDDNTGFSGNYNVQVQDSSTSTAQTSQNAAVVVREAVHFTTSPQPQTKNVTEDVTFTAVAAGGYPDVSGYAYVWTWNGNVLTDGPHFSGSGSTVSGATTATLTITGLGEDDEGTYVIRANDSKAPCPAHNKCTATASAFLTVTNNIVIVDDPDSLDVYATDAVSFSITPGGGNPVEYVYEWYWDFGSGGVQLSNGSHPSGTGASVSGATTATLSISNVQTGATPATRDAGEYYAIVRDGSGNNPGQSNPAVLAVYPAVRFTSNPVSVNKYENESATFTVTASGGLRNERSFQWQEDSGSGFGNLSNGGRVSGATSTTLSVSSLTLADDNNRYRCVVTSPDSDVPTLPSNLTHTSSAATLRVSEPLTILDAPANKAAYVTDPAFDLRVHFEGGMPPYSSNWKRAGVTPFISEVSVGAGQILLGAPNTTVLTVNPGAVAPGVHAYAVELTDQVKTTRSASGTVEIANELSFVRGLSNAFVRARQRFEWSIEVNGGLGPIEYQWYKNVDPGKAFQIVPEDPFHQGTTTDTLTFVEIDFDDAGAYMVQVNDDFMVIQSQAQMVVGTALPVAGLTGLAMLAAASAAVGALRLRRRGR